MRWVRRVLERATLVAALAAAGPARAPAARGPGDVAVPPAPAIEDAERALDVNAIRCRVSNLGVLGYDLYTGSASFECPQGSDRKPIFSIGLWLLGEIFGTPRTVGSAISDYDSEFNPGPANSRGPVDPSGSDPSYRVYKIGRDDLTSPGADYLSWPALQGAPVDATGQPLLLGDQTLFCVYNDADPSRHHVLQGSTAPLGVEVRQTVYAFNRPFELTSVMIARYEIQNRSLSRLPELYVALWMDPDLGDPNDDLAGCDTTVGAVFAYDGAFGSDSRGSVPPAVGAVLLADSLTNRPRAGLHATAAYPASLDPDSFGESLNLIRGLDKNGQPWMCSGAGTRFPYAGDPATSACPDSAGGDKRLLLSVGPYDVNPGSTVFVTVAFLVASDPRARTSADNVPLLLRTAQGVRDRWFAGFASLPEPPRVTRLGAPFPNPFGNLVEFDVQVPKGETPPRQLEVLDARGRIVWTEPITTLRPGYNRLAWSGRTRQGIQAPAGVYVLRLITEHGPLVTRAARLSPGSTP